MKSKTTFFIVLFSLLIFSFLIALAADNNYPDLPLPVFQVVCTVLLASFALPGILGISDSKIVKALFLIFFQDSVLLSFPVFQVLLAIVALISEHRKVICNDSTLFTSWLFILCIIDLVYILWYLLYIIHLFGSPRPMLRMFEKRIEKKIKRLGKLKYSSRKMLKEEILTLAKISKDTTNDDKSYAIETFSRLLTAFLNPQYSHNSNPNVPTDFQLEVWSLLVESVSITCMGSNDSYAGSEKNASSVIDIITKAWEATDKWVEKGSDYATVARELRKIGQFAAMKGYETSVKKALDALSKIAEVCIHESPSPRVSVSFITLDIEKLGSGYIKAGGEILVHNFVLALSRVYFFCEKKTLYLFHLLNFMSFVWYTNRDTLAELTGFLSKIEDSKVSQAVKYGEKHSSSETMRIKRFLEAMDRYKNPRYAFIRKILKFWEEIV